jgi:hypothetical protein
VLLEVRQAVPLPEFGDLFHSLVEVVQGLLLKPVGLLEHTVVPGLFA